MRKLTDVFVGFLFVFSISNISCVRSPAVIARHPKNRSIDNNVLIDKKKHMKYILDSTESFITAIDSAGNEIWKKDPWVDYKIWVYFLPTTKREAERLKRNREPMQYFLLEPIDIDLKELKKGESVIKFGYGNMFGAINTRNGEFYSLGQD